MLRAIALAEVTAHDKEGDAWIVIDGQVYDISSFAKLHPGGAVVLRPFYGKDATTAFYDLHRQEVLVKYKRLVIGTVEGYTSPPPAGLVPYAESSGFMEFKSPYFNASHLRFRAAVREFYDTHINPVAAKYELSGKAPPRDLWRKLGQANILAARMGPGPWLNGLALPGGVKPEEFDYFHTLIVLQEVGRTGCPSFSDGITAGFMIGMPPVLHFAEPSLKARVAQDVLSGEKQICLAISEPFAGSDVASIKTTAVKSSDGSHYIVNGVKKWITNGTFSDYFVTAVKTSETGMSVLLIERSEGVSTKLISTSYGGAAGTAYVVFDNVRVPVRNLLGKENQGFKIIMNNFNYERWMIIAFVHRMTRLIVEECFKWAHQRKVFGKPLISQPVIRFKLAEMVADVESVENWLENITFQMNQMSASEQSKHLAGPIALLKYKCTRVQLAVSDHAVQIFGGRGITKTGMGQVIERAQRAIKYAAILGGSEEIMADLGIRQAIKTFPRTAKL